MKMKNEEAKAIVAAAKKELDSEKLRFKEWKIFSWDEV